ncbi:Protein of unknown function [Pyronema omphalodes CBS 100304]|uniref:Uncharacterized protein n=1 Tax=Pyronema omphalodes (strain CBS 100304) TaxID=1076935 RepID=U4LDG2_PYROM|nr:Protein of unknown function [Pyronema omphalodes CBS 100304]
MFRMSRSLP